MRTKSASSNDPRRKLPSVSDLLKKREIQGLISNFSRPLVLQAIRTTLETARKGLAETPEAVGPDSLIAQMEAALQQKESERLRYTVNATGIILHTNLGRAVLPQNAVDALADMNRCCNVQINLGNGLRGMRNHVTEQLLCEITGAEAAMIVNNNAAATYLILTALCKGKEVIVSRGQLIEIGGSYRLPDCITESGARICEVGTTNRTHLRDYEQALCEETGAILRANASNYRIVGFSKEVPIEELAALKKKRPVLVIDDLGCGAFVDLNRFGLPREPTVQKSIQAGVDIACFSGDKLIGGPQAGIICGRKELIKQIKAHPMTRILRVCKLTDAALEHTLRLFLEPETLHKTNPTYRMLAVKKKTLKARAEELKQKLDRRHLPFSTAVRKGQSAMGGGSLPAVPIDTFVLAVRPETMSPDAFSALLRTHTPPVVARISDEEIVFDMRTLLEGEAEAVFNAINHVYKKTNKEPAQKGNNNGDQY